MLDIGWSEFLIIGVIALIVIGPKDLPRTARTLAQWVRKARSLAREFQSGLDEMMRESELDSVKKDIEESLDPKDIGGSIKKDIEDSLDPDGTVADAMKLEGDIASPDFEMDDNAPDSRDYESASESREPEAAADEAEHDRTVAQPPAENAKTGTT
jgi:sec-independent protein translocase protein TatB